MRSAGSTRATSEGCERRRRSEPVGHARPAFPRRPRRSGDHARRPRGPRRRTRRQGPCGDNFVEDSDARMGRRNPDVRGRERSEAADLRVRADSPAQGVHAPDRGASKSKVYLYPTEFSALVSCADVPHRWRRMFAITTCLYARAGDVNALTWADVDLDRGVVRIHASVDRRTGELTTTKTEETRRVPIDPALLPLLRAMHNEAGGVGRVSPVEAKDDHVSRSPRDGDHVVRCPRRRSPPDQTTCGSLHLQHDGGLHPRGREPPRSQLRDALPAAPGRASPALRGGAKPRRLGGRAARSNFLTNIVT